MKNNIIDITKINPVEVIDYLNTLDKDDAGLYDSNIQGPYIYEKFKLEDDRVIIYFSTYFNNWGTDQLIEDNHIVIYKDKIKVALEEPLEGDGTDDILEELISNWIQTHTFKTADEKIIEYRSLMDSIQSLSSDSTPNLDNVKIIIEKAERARTLIE